MKGFKVAADAIVPCKACGSVEGVPCVGNDLKRGQVHFGRRLSRLLLTDPEKRAAFERKALAMLHEELRRRGAS